jgi:hypothetical protein
LAYQSVLGLSVSPWLISQPLAYQSALGLSVICRQYNIYFVKYYTHYFVTIAKIAINQTISKTKSEYFADVFAIAAGSSIAAEFKYPFAKTSKFVDVKSVLNAIIELNKIRIK